MQNPGRFRLHEPTVGVGPQGALAGPIDAAFAAGRVPRRAPR